MTDTPRKRRRGPTLSRAITQALKAGVVPVGATIEPDGKISLEFGKCDSKDEQKNDLDNWMAKHAY
jgi:hypothetical protein